jgi:hypothetical protein
LKLLKTPFWVKFAQRIWQNAARANPLAAERGPCHSSAMKFSRLLQFALGLASLFPPGLPLSGQLLRVGTSDNIPIGKLETMNDALQIADREPIFDF